MLAPFHISAFYNRVGPCVQLHLINLLLFFSNFWIFCGQKIGGSGRAAEGRMHRAKKMNYTASKDIFLQRPKNKNMVIMTDLGRSSYILHFVMLTFDIVDIRQRNTFWQISHEMYLFVKDWNVHISKTVVIWKISYCIFSNFLNHSRTGCICFIFPHHASSNVSSNCLPERMHNHTGCICLTFPHCVFSYGP